MLGKRGRHHQNFTTASPSHVHVEGIFLLAKMIQTLFCICEDMRRTEVPASESGMLSGYPWQYVIARPEDDWIGKPLTAALGIRSLCLTSQKDGLHVLGAGECCRTGLQI